MGGIKLPTGHTLVFGVGETVYFPTDDEQTKYLVTGHTLRPNGLVIYLVSSSGVEKSAYAIELSTQKTY